MEIKTAEHYVVAELQDTKKENEKLKAEIEAQHDELTYLYEMKRRIREDLHVAYLDTIKDSYVDFQTVFKKSNPEKFAWYLRVFEFEEPKEETEDE